MSAFPSPPPATDHDRRVRRTGPATDHDRRTGPASDHDRRVRRTSPVTDHDIRVRHTRPDDEPAIAALAALDTAPALTGPVLVCELGGRPVAALDLRDGRIVADPFTPTLAAVEVLRTRARQLGAAGPRRRSGSAVVGTPRRRRFPALRLLALAAAAAATLAGANADHSQARGAPPTGMFSGAIDLAAPSPGVDPAQLAKGSILLRVYRDAGSVRITGLYVALRTFCPGGAAVQDVRLDREPASGKGPKVGPKGGFAFSGNGIRVRGTVTRQRAEGTVVADAAGGCHGRGTFRIARRPGS